MISINVLCEIGEFPDSKDRRERKGRFPKIWATTCCAIGGTSCAIKE